MPSLSSFGLAWVCSLEANSVTVFGSKYVYHRKALTSLESVPLSGFKLTLSPYKFTTLLSRSYNNLSHPRLFLIPTTTFQYVVSFRCCHTFGHPICTRNSCCSNSQPSCYQHRGRYSSIWKHKYRPVRDHHLVWWPDCSKDFPGTCFFLSSRRMCINYFLFTRLQSPGSPRTSMISPQLLWICELPLRLWTPTPSWSSTL